MTEAEQWAIADAYEGETMIAFTSKAAAMRYVLHRYSAHGAERGLIAAAEDTREGTGLYVMWRDPVRGHELRDRITKCHRVLEDMLAGDLPTPMPGEALDFSGRLKH